MMSLDISSNVDEVLRETDFMFEHEVPFTLSQAMNDAAFDARKRIVFSTYPNAFTVRNKVFPGRLFRVIKRARKGDLEAVVGQVLDYEYMVRHATGGIKRASDGGSIAIPQGIQRTGTGRIPIGKKPTRIRAKKGAFVKRGRGNSRLVMERTKNDTLRLWYVLTPQAKIDKTFRFYEDGIATLERTILGHWQTRYFAAVRKSRIFSGR